MCERIVITCCDLVPYTWIAAKRRDDGVYFYAPGLSAQDAFEELALVETARQRLERCEPVRLLEGETEDELTCTLTVRHRRDSGDWLIEIVAANCISEARVSSIVRARFGLIVPIEADHIELDGDQRCGTFLYRAEGVRLGPNVHATTVYSPERVVEAFGEPL